MPGHSGKTEPISFRIPVELYAIIQKRIEKRLGRWANVNEYAKERFIYDAQRKH